MIHTSRPILIFYAVLELYFHVIGFARTYRFIHGLLLKVADYLINLNFFPLPLPTTDQYDLNTQKIATRAFILTLLLSSCILFIYTAAATTLKAFTISNPTLQQYIHFYQQSPDTLTCTCSQVSVKYGAFIQIDYSVHQICLSMYTRDDFPTHITTSTSALLRIDFRFSSRQMFQGLRAMCQLAAESIRTNLDQFYSSNYVSAAATSEDLLRSKSEAIVNQFISSTTSSFLLSLRLIRNTTQANALVSGLFTNFEFNYYYMELSLTSQQRDYDDCSCAYYSTCTSSAGIYHNASLPSTWSVPGFYIGCFIFEALRQSNLHCFYNQTCLDDLQSHWESRQELRLQLLDPSALHYFDVMTPVGVIIDRLMVDVWNWTITHGNYYGVCQPKECRYTKVARNGVVIIVTTVIGLVGGLVTVERLIIPKLISVAFRCIRRKRINTVEICDNASLPVSQSPAMVQVEDLEN
jgi:hypothetical protein